MTARDLPLSHEELRLLYQVTVSDLTHFKTQQWSVTNYTVLLFVGLVGVAQMLRPNISNVERVALAALAVAAGLGSLGVLAKLQRSIRVRQARLDAVRDQFSSAFNSAWAAEVKGREYLHAIWFLGCVVAVGGVLVAWLVGFRL